VSDLEGRAYDRETMGPSHHCILGQDHDVDNLRFDLGVESCTSGLNTDKC